MIDELPFYDLIVIGGGINGTGIALDAAGRGLKVLLVEQNDLASATSSASSKLIHGGLRYLEHYEFKLVKEALGEREVLLNKAPHLIRPLSFILPHERHLRPALMIRAGLFLYDHLGPRQRLPASRQISFEASSPLKSDFKKGFLYTDCWVDDARLVVSNALSAARLGAKIRTYTRCSSVSRDCHPTLGEHFQLTLVGSDDNQLDMVYGKALVNATGPWVDKFLNEKASQPKSEKMRLIQGSHLIVPKFYQEDCAYILQNPDQRIVFVSPYFDDYALIGTTDQDITGIDNPAGATTGSNEINYLINTINHYFKQQLGTNDILKTTVGVRALYGEDHNDPSKLSRDYVIKVSDKQNQAPLISVFGGKITTYRTLSEAVMDKLRPYYPNLAHHWTEHKPLAGGDEHPVSLSQRLTQRYPKIPVELLKRYIHSYGTLTEKLLDTSQTISELGEHFAGQLYAKEVDYLVEHEWARTAEDILWRRTKQGLKFNSKQVTQLEIYLSNKFNINTKHPSKYH